MSCKTKLGLKSRLIMEKMQEIAQLTSREICVTVSDVGFGLKEANPLRLVGFFRKEDPLR